MYELFCLTQELRTPFLVLTCVYRLARDGGHTIAAEMAETRVKGIPPGTTALFVEERLGLLRRMTGSKHEAATVAATSGEASRAYRDRGRAASGSRCGFPGQGGGRSRGAGEPLFRRWRRAMGSAQAWFTAGGVRVETWIPARASRVHLLPVRIKATRETGPGPASRAGARQPGIIQIDLTMALASASTGVWVPQRCGG